MLLDEDERELLLQPGMQRRRPRRRARRLELGAGAPRHARDRGRQRPAGQNVLDTGLVEHLRADGFSWQPAKTLDWMVCDMVEQPRRVAARMAEWFREGWCRHAVFNLKLPMKKRWDETALCLDLFAAAGAAAAHDPRAPALPRPRGDHGLRGHRAEITRWRYTPAACRHSARASGGMRPATPSIGPRSSVASRSSLVNIRLIALNACADAALSLLRRARPAREALRRGVIARAAIARRECCRATRRRRAGRGSRPARPADAPRARHRRAAARDRRRSDRRAAAAAGMPRVASAAATRPGARRRRAVEFALEAVFVEGEHALRLGFRQRPHDRTCNPPASSPASTNGSNASGPPGRNRCHAVSACGCSERRRRPRRAGRSRACRLAMPASSRTVESAPSAASTSRASQHARHRPAAARAPSSCCSQLDHARRAMHVHAGRRQRRPQAVDQQAVLDDPAELAPRQCVGVEFQLAIAGRIPDPHAAIGLHARGAHRGPHAEFLQQRGVVGRERIHAQVALRRPTRATVRALRPAPRRGRASPAPARPRRRPRRRRPRRRRVDRCSACCGGSCGVAPAQPRHFAAIAQRAADQQRLHRWRWSSASRPRPRNGRNSGAGFAVSFARPSEKASVRSRSSRRRCA